jgi:hypothetical protein
MEIIYSREQIIDDMYADYHSDRFMSIPGFEESCRLVEEIKKSMLEMEEIDFIQLCERCNISLGRFIKNRYYLKRTL